MLICYNLQQVKVSPKEAAREGGIYTWRSKTITNKIKRPCAYPGCPEVVSGERCCDKHKTQYHCQENEKRERPRSAVTTAAGNNCG